MTDPAVGAARHAGDETTTPNGEPTMTETTAPDPAAADDIDWEWDDQRDKYFFHCTCVAPEPVDDEPWVPVECGNCGGRLP